MILFGKKIPILFLTVGVVCCLGDCRPGQAVDHRAAIFRCDRRGNYDHPDGEIQRGGGDLVALLCARYGAGAARRHSYRRADGQSAEPGKDPRHVGQYLHQRADLSAGADPDGGDRHRRNHRGGHGVSLRGLRHHSRHAGRHQAGGPIASRNGALLRRDATSTLHQNSLLERPAGNFGRRKIWA